MTKEEKMLKRLNANSNYGAFPTPKSSDKIDLIIRCKSNKDYCRINTIKFRNVNNGNIITIDRNHAEYVIETLNDINGYRYRIDMLWIDCYIWDGYTKDYNIDFNELEFVEFEIDEEAADVDYKLELIECKPSMYSYLKHMKYELY